MYLGIVGAIYQRYTSFLLRAILPFASIAPIFQAPATEVISSSADQPVRTRTTYFYAGWLLNLLVACFILDAASFA